VEEAKRAGFTGLLPLSETGLCAAARAGHGSATGAGRVNEPGVLPVTTLNSR
jgi:hypothetical protein